MGWGDLNDRFDPLPLQASFFLNRLESAGQVQLVPFRSIASGFANGFAAGREQQSFEQTPNVQLRPTNLQADGRWTFGKAIYLATQDIPAVAKPPKAGSIIFNNTNSQTLVGKTGVWRDHDGITPYLSNHMTEIEMASGLDPDCYAAVLNIYREQRVFYNLCTNWNNQSGFAGDRLRALPIPKLTDHQQEAISTILGHSQHAASAKEAEAAALLASIDDYLLSELGIVLPPETVNTLANRTFRVKAYELGGWRFDPPVHQSDFSLQSYTIESVPLGRICHVNPRTAFSQLQGVDLAGFVPMDAISDRLGIVEYQSHRPIEECVGYTTFRDKDVLWAKITPCMENGKSAVVDGLANGVGFGSTEFHVIRPRNASVLPDYVHALLRMGRVRREAKRFFTGSSGHRRVDDAFLRKLVVPVPPLELQIRLIEEVRAKRDQAIALEKAATAQLETAKREVEAILLGGAA